jgi:hypothetical protein
VAIEDVLGILVGAKQHKSLSGILWSIASALFSSQCLNFCVSSDRIAAFYATSQVFYFLHSTTTMALVSTRISEIKEKEKFSIKVFDLQRQEVPDENGKLGAYDGWKYKAEGKMSVTDWIKNRFEVQYRGYTCDVLMSDGSRAHGNSNLKTVRDSY